MTPEQAAALQARYAAYRREWRDANVIVNHRYDGRRP